MRLRKRLVNRHMVSLFFAFAALVAQAQGPGGGPPPGASRSILSLASDLAALTARVAKLEGQIAAADLVGAYAIHGIQNELRAPNNLPPGAAAQVASCKLIFGVPPSVAPHSLSAPDEASTWTYAGGVLTIAGLPIPLNVVAGGRVMIGVHANHSDGTNVLLILTRLR